MNTNSLFNKMYILSRRWKNVNKMIELFFNTHVLMFSYHKHMLPNTIPMPYIYAMYVRIQYLYMQQT